MLQPDIDFIASPMGGGWAIPLTDLGDSVGEEVFGEPSEMLAPIAACGWLVEPQDADDICHALLAEGLTLRAASGRILQGAA